MNPQIIIGWKRTYTNPTVPVTSFPLTSGDPLLYTPDPLHKVTVFLEKLYRIPGMRGYDLYELAYVKKGEHGNFLLDQGMPISFVYPGWKDPEDSPAKWYQRNQQTIDHLLQRYPGLFVVQKETPPPTVGGGSYRRRKVGRTSTKRSWKRQSSRNRKKIRNRIRKTKRGKRTRNQRLSQ